MEWQTKDVGAAETIRTYFFFFLNYDKGSPA